MKKRAFSVFLSLTIVFCAISAYLTQAAAEQFLGSGAWHVDDEGALVQEDGYYVYTIKPGDIEDGVATIRFDPIASPNVLIEDNYHPGSNTGVKVKLVNESGQKLVWESGGYDFTTVNTYQVGGPIPLDISQFEGFEAVDYGTEEHPYEIQYGTAYQTIPNSFDVLGFDDQYIRFAVAAVRTSNKPMARLFGKEDPYDVTLTEAVQVDSRVKEALSFRDADGHERAVSADADRTYADYLKLYYNVDSLEDLTNRQKLEVLGGEMEFKSFSEDPSERFDPNTTDPMFDQFKLYGIIKPNNHYQMLETDPELLAMGYHYLYSNCMRFTFDAETSPIDGVKDSANGMSIADFMEKDSGSAATQSAENVFGGTVLNENDVLTLDHLAFAYQAPNAFNWMPHCIDFNFALKFDVDDGDASSDPGSSSEDSSHGGGGGGGGGGGDDRPDPTPSEDPSSNPPTVPETPSEGGGSAGGGTDTSGTTTVPPEGSEEANASTDGLSGGHIGGDDSSGGTSGKPKTGDHTLALLAVSATLAVGSGILCVFFRDKKEDKEETQEAK